MNSLQKFFQQHKKCAIAFSGGTDSAYLLYCAKIYEVEVCAYYVNSDFQPKFELEDAKRIAKELNVPMKILPLDVLKDLEIKCNPVNRCYYCKKKIFSSIKEAAIKDGYEVLLDGTNASDQVDDRPGMKAIEELSVLSPLRMCGITKEDVRRLSKEGGLFTWDKPSYACLATRIPHGMGISNHDLIMVEQAETMLTNMGYRNFRLRLSDEKEHRALLQVDEKQLEKARKELDYIQKALAVEFQQIMLDEEHLRTTMTI